MKTTWTIDFSSEGAPMLIGNVDEAQHWRGDQDDGSGVVVSFWAEGLEKLPKEFSEAKKVKPTGRARAVKLATTAEADAFEADLTRRFLKLHPGAARPPMYPDYPVWYRGDFMKNERVFGIERTFTSAYKAMLKKLKGDVASVVIDKKQKAKALFFEMEGGGPGAIAADATTGTIIVATVVTAGADAKRDLAKAIADATLPKKKPIGEMLLGERVVAVDSALSAARIAKGCWGTLGFAAGAENALKKADHASIEQPEQVAPIGACFRCKPGKYRYAVARDCDAGDTLFNALWMWL